MIKPENKFYFFQKVLQFLLKNWTPDTIEEQEELLYNYDMNIIMTF